MAKTEKTAAAKATALAAAAAAATSQAKAQARSQALELGDRLTPVVDDARERLAPVVVDARERLVDLTGTVATAVAAAFAGALLTRVSAALLLRRRTGWRESA